MGARDTRRATTWIAAALATIVVGLASSPAAGEMRTTKLDRHLCKTVHGGRFAPDRPAGGDHAGSDRRDG